MLFGYARVSKADGQDTAAQVTALRAVGCKRVYEERMTGTRWDRPELQRLLDHLREGDVLVVWKLDRLGRSLKDLLFLLEKVAATGAGFRSITEHVDTTTPAGRLMMQMLGAFAEFEAAIVKERTRAGLAQARSEGRVGGRKPKLSRRQVDAAVEMVLSGEKSAADVARLFDVHPSTVSRLLAQHRLRNP